MVIAPVAVVILSSEISDETEMERAREELTYAQEHGINQEVWHVYGSDTNNYPEYKRRLSEKLLR